VTRDAAALRYTPLARLGVGGMAEVLAALEQGGAAARLVAIKRVLPNLVEEREVVEMFRDEAALVSRIDHPNVGRAFGLEPGGRFLVMEYLEGAGLDRLVRLSPRALRGVPARIALALARQAAIGLDAAHELRGDGGEPARVVHRDVSPANLFVTRAGVLKVIDFGIAKAEWMSRQTRAGLRRGKSGYMSPEQVRARPLDRRSDVFSLGVVLWELLAGRPLFSRASELDSMHAVLVATVPGLGPTGVPASIERVVRRALDRDPGARWPTARGFAAAIDEAAVAIGGVASPAELGRWVDKVGGPALAERRAAVADAARLVLAAGAAEADLTEPGPPPRVARTGELGLRRAMRIETQDPFAEPTELDPLERLERLGTPPAAVAAGEVDDPTQLDLAPTFVEERTGAFDAPTALY
jgi:eukaryotic-like serine/threonine-protein kinase